MKFEIDGDVLKRCTPEEGETTAVVPKGVKAIGKNAFRFKTGLESVVIPEGVTVIGESAFYGCEKLESVVIPKGVTEIGAGAFKYCNSLESVVIPEGVTEIGEWAFSECGKLKSIVIPKGVTEIGKWAFSECENLEGVVIPEGVTVIGFSAFSRCKNLKSVVIPEGVTVIGEWAFRNCEKLESVVIPEGVTVIGYSAFRECKNLKSVVIPEGVTEIGKWAFEGCRNLDRMILSDGGSVLIHCPPAIAVGDVVIPESVRRIGAGAFRECKNLSEITLPENVSTVSERAFEGCVNLKRVHIASPSTHIEPGAFVGCTGLEHMILTDNETVLVYCPPACANGHVRLPETVTRIEEFAFAKSNQLSAVEFPEGLREIGLRAFIGCTQLSAVNFPEGLLKIELGAFEDCTQLSAVNFPDGLLEIGRGAFDGCPLKSVTLPPSVKNAPEYAFPGCREITIYDSIDADGGDCYENFKSNIDRGQSASKIGLMPIRRKSDPLNCTIIVRSAATGDIKYIVEVEIDYGSGNRDYRNLFFFGWGKNATFAFRELDKIFPKIEGRWRKIRVALSRLQYGVDLDDETRSYYCKYLSRSAKPALEMCIIDNRLEWIEMCAEIGILKKDVLEYGIPLAINANRTAITAYLLDYKNTHFPDARKKADKEFELPSLPKEKKPLDKISAAYMKKIWKCEELEDGSLSLVKYAGEDTEIVIPDSIGGKVISSIGEMAFSPKQPRILSSLKKARTSIVSVTFGNNIHEIGKNAFDGCISIEDLSFSEGTIVIGKRAFAGCSALKKLTFATSIQKVEEGAFEYCSALRNISLSENTVIESDVFFGCKSLELDKIIYGNNGTVIQYFPSSRAIGTLEIPEGVEKIGNNVFSGCDQLISVQLPKSIKCIGAGAFAGCKNLEKVTILGKLEQIETEAFFGCLALKTLESPYDLSSVECGEDVFIPALPEIVLLAPKE